MDCFQFSYFRPFVIPLCSFGVVMQHVLLARHAAQQNQERDVFFLCHVKIKIKTLCLVAA